MAEPVLTEKDIDDLLAQNDELFLNIYSFQCSGHALPGKSHHGAAIAYQDIVERRQDFLRELKITMCSWIYSKQKYKEIYDAEFARRGESHQNASSAIHALVREKFRKGKPQGQFGELLLFNFIQHLFKAVPILRKMNLTTNPAVERHGADAIHYRPRTGEHVVYLGEAKSYASKYKFSEALEASVDSVLRTLENLSSELGLYVYEDFIDECLRNIARDIKSNNLSGVVFELVCVVSYSETKNRSGSSQNEITERIKDIVNARLKQYENLLAKKDQIRIGRIHFVLVPFWDFEALLTEFDS